MYFCRLKNKQIINENNLPMVLTQFVAHILKILGKALGKEI